VFSEGLARQLYWTLDLGLLTVKVSRTP